MSDGRYIGRGLGETRGRRGTACETGKRGGVRNAANNEKVSRGIETKA